MWEGLGLVDFTVVPHCGSPTAEGEAAARVVDELSRRRLPHRTFGDGEALLVRDGSVRLVTE